MGAEYSILEKGSKSGLLRICFELIKEFFQVRPSVVYASGQFATLFAIPISTLTGVKHRIFTRHHSNLHHKPNMKMWLTLDKICNHFASKIVVVSKTLYEFLIENEKVVPEKLLLINNGIDLDRFRAEDRVSRFDCDYKKSKNDSIEFGVVARLTEWKGLDLLLRHL